MSARRIERSPRASCVMAIGLLFATGGSTNCSAQSESQIGSGAPFVSPMSVQEAEDLFAHKIAPLLKAKCYPCHGDDEEKVKGGLDLRTRAGLLKGGDTGPVLRPGEPAKSPMYIAVTWDNQDLQMPPKENDRLSPQEIEALRQWIAAGAPWPTGSKSATASRENASNWSGANSAEGVTVRTSGGLSPEWNDRRYQPKDLWAYQPIRQPAVPQVQNPKSETQNPIDAFVRTKLIESGLDTAPPADKLTLIRRATFDLTGLPPTPEEIDRFMNDTSPEAFAKLAARLLDSPHYGEQQARHWFDVVRYADTAGFSNDYERPNAWRYRDYVVRSFNQDKPYDRFIMEQVAGDELEPDNPEMLIAGGFLRLGPWEHTGMTVAAVTRQQFLNDVTHSIGVTFLGRGLCCASCHDHKFDPVPTRDYYRMQAVFAPAQFAELPVAFLPEENIANAEASKARAASRMREAQDALVALRKKNSDAIEELMKQYGVASAAELPRKDYARRDNIGLTKQELTLRKIHEKRRDYFERELKRFEPYAFSVYSGPPNQYTSVRPLYDRPARRQGTVPAVHILTGGALESPSEPVTPGVLSAMRGWSGVDLPPGQQLIPESTEGRRLALARWIASSNNTLTARVIVNRIWQQHFSRGLVATPNNFGKMGSRPSHPGLLDWLATWFVDHGWSLKKLHALIMSSAAYRQNGQSHLAPAAAADPANSLLAHFPPRRLAAEEIRDAMLAVTGELNREMGGPGVFPEINWEVALQPRHIMGSVAPAYQPSPTPRERNRRTIYAFRIRTLGDPMMEVLNRPGTETSCERRDETTVTPQAFALFNSEFIHDRALALAVTLEKRAIRLSDQIREAFRLCYGRDPSQNEIEMCEQHVARMSAHHREHQPEPTELPTSVTRHMVEEMTGEDVSWEETLEGMTDYQRDLKPWQVGPQTRALADLCLVLLNSNEFLYVR